MNRLVFAGSLVLGFVVKVQIVAAETPFDAETFADQLIRENTQVCASICDDTDSIPALVSFVSGANRLDRQDLNDDGVTDPERSYLAVVNLILNRYGAKAVRDTLDDFQIEQGSLAEAVAFAVDDL